MKRLILALLVAVAFAGTANADNNETKYVAAFDMSSHIEAVCSTLKLNAEQSREIDALSEIFCEQIDRVSYYNDNNEREDLLAKTVGAHLNGVRKVLNTAQYDKYKASIEKAVHNNELMAFIK